MGYQLIWEPQGLLIKHVGKLTAEEIIQSINEGGSHENFDTLRYRILDLTDIAQSEVEIDDVQKFIAYDAAISMSNTRLQFAIVANEETLQALSSLYILGATNSPWQTQQFRSLEQARKWID